MSNVLLIAYLVGSSLTILGVFVLANTVGDLELKRNLRITGLFCSLLWPLVLVCFTIAALLLTVKTLRDPDNRHFDG